MAEATFSGPLSDAGLVGLNTTGLEFMFIAHETGLTTTGRVIVKGEVRATVTSTSYSVKLQTTDDVYPASFYYNLRIRRSLDGEVLFDDPSWKLYAPSGGGSLWDMLAPPDWDRKQQSFWDARYVRQSQLAGAVATALADSDVVRDAAAEAATEAVDVALNASPRIPTFRYYPGHAAVILDGAGKPTFMDANSRDGGPSRQAAKLIGHSVGVEHVEWPGHSVSLVDAAGRATFMDANDTNGAPTDHAAQLIAGAVEPYIGGSGGGAPAAAEFILEMSSGSLYSNSLVTQRRTRLTTGLTIIGTPTISGSMAVFSTSGGLFWVPLEGGTVERVVPSKNWVGRGDSMMNGAAGEGVNLLTTLASILQVEAFNDGHGGYGSLDVAVNAGAEIPQFTVADNMIPTSGAVEILNVSPTDGWRGFGGNSVIRIDGRLAGVAGQMEYTTATGVRRFIRNSSGSATACPPGTSFFPDGTGYRDRTQVIWVGRNNISYPNAILRDVKAMVDYQTALLPRTLVLGVCTSIDEIVGTSGYNRIATINNALAAVYGDRFLDIRRYLIDNGLADAGLTPTDADREAIANDTIPPQLLHSDGLHLLRPGLIVVGTRVAARAVSLGWN
jgi:hypothetical protein